MPNLLQNPLVIAIAVLVLVLLIAIPVLIRRRRAGREEVLPPPELSQPIDYTSLPYEEPSGWRDRLARASPATKLLLVLVPLVVIVGGVILALTFLQPLSSAGNPTPVVPPPEITNLSANVAGPTKILVEAETNLPDGASVMAVLKENGQDFPWYIESTATAQVRDGQIRVTLEKRNDAPIPTEGRQYTVVLTATANGQTITSEPAEVSVPSIYRAAFFQSAAAAPTTAPTAAPTVVASPPAPTAAPPTAPAEPTVEPTATSATTLTATVFNGGNIRQEPNLQGTVLGQLHAGEVVSLLERSANGEWYRVAAPEATGWVHRSLLTIDEQVASQVPQATPAPTGLTARVFNGGNVRERPVTGRPLDQIHAGETVQLLEKTADGGWYHIINPRNVTGWVHRSLLTIDPDVARQVPVAR